MEEDKRLVTIADVLDEMALEQLKKSYMLMEGRNLAKAEQAKLKNLRSTATPKWILDKKIEDLSGGDVARWIFWINSDTEADHPPFGGAHVRNLKNHVKKMVDWLFAKGYIDEDKRIFMIIGLSANKSKPMSALRKEDRPFPKIKDIKKVMNYYWKRDYVNHREHVMVTMMVMMFCTGVRVCEAIGLRWQDVQFDDEVLDNNIISINNSINMFERREQIHYRLEHNHRVTKNRSSIRRITMWASYRDYFKDYYEWYKSFYRLYDEEMADKFVFPVAKKRAGCEWELDYVHIVSVRRDFRNIFTKVGIKEDYTPAMFRHGTAYYLAYERPYSIEQIKDYFGHSDTKMIEKVYAPLLAEEKRKKVSRVMADLIEDEKTLIPGIVKSRKKEINMDDELLNIKDAIIQGKSTYTYSDTDIMMDIITNQPMFLQMIKFEKAKEQMEEEGNVAE